MLCENLNQLCLLLMQGFKERKKGDYVELFVASCRNGNAGSKDELDWRKFTEKKV